jgi:hypothetical protein
MYSIYCTVYGRYHDEVRVMSGRLCGSAGWQVMYICCVLIEPHNGFFQTLTVYGRCDDKVRP